MVVAVDFDNTLFETNYPEIIRPRRGVIDSVKYLKEKGYQIILNTCRTDEYLDAALEACDREGLVFDAINENLSDRVERYGGDARKISADFYLDDGAINPNDPGFLVNILNKKISG